MSISGPDDEKCELVTPILTYDDIETLQSIIRLLRKAGAKSSPSRGCGVHIHIGKGNHTAKTLRNLVNIMASHEEQIGRAIRIDAGRTGHYCKVVNQRFLEQLNKKKPTTMSQLEDTWYEGNGANYGRTQHYNDSRYHMLNLHATFTKVTPLLQGGVHVNPVDIGGILGTLRWTGTNYADKTGIWTFTRSEPGEELLITRPTAIRTAFDRERNGPDEIMVIFIGQNGGYKDIADLIRTHRMMIDHCKGKEYVVLGLSSGTESQRKEYEDAMKDVRQALLQDYRHCSQVQ